MSLSAGVILRSYLYVFSLRNVSTSLSEVEKAFQAQGHFDAIFTWCLEVL